MKEENSDIAFNWFRLGNPLKLMLRALFFEIIKLMPPTHLKNFLYGLCGVKIGKNVAIGPNVIIDPLFPRSISIGDNTIIGWGAKIFAHEYTLKNFRNNPVKIGRSVLVGAFSHIKQGIKIGDNSIVCAESYVNKNVPQNTMVGGVPAKLIRRLK